MSDMWRHLGEFLKIYSEKDIIKKPGQIRIPAKKGASSCEFQTVALEKGIVDLHGMLNRANPVKDVLDAIAKAYGIDPILLAPYEGSNVAGPVVVAPPKKPRKSLAGLYCRRQAEGVYYCYPTTHLAGARLYPVYFTVKVAEKIHTPFHWHPGTEILAVIKGVAKEKIEYDSDDIILKNGELLHFYSDQKHQTTNISENEFLQVWAFRELVPLPSTSLPHAILGHLLKSWRLQQKEELSIAAGRGSFKPETLELFELQGKLPFKSRNSLTILQL